MFEAGGTRCLSAPPTTVMTEALWKSLVRDSIDIHKAGFFQEYGFSKKCRCGLINGVEFPESAREVTCGVGNMLLLARSNNQ